jgi:hypothetical protein
MQYSKDEVEYPDVQIEAEIGEIFAIISWVLFSCW